MKRVLIVDDDFLVRTYLKQMIPWEEQGFYIIGDAKNGREALEILQRDGADILIADVSMPIMDGIELTRHAKKLSPRTHILIFSCHDDFVYVKEAMKLGIDDYLLKNDLSEETLLDALKKISFDAEDNSEIERLALIGRKKLREDFFRAFDAGETDKLERLAADAEISAAFKAAAAFMIIPQRWQEREQILAENERENFLAAFAEMTSNTCRNLLGEKIQPLIFDSTRGGFFHWGLLVEGGTREIAERLRNFSKLYFNLELKIFLSPPKKNLAAPAEQWLKIFDARADSFYSDEKIFSVENLPPLSIKIPDALKNSGREVVEALSFIDEDFAVVLKNFREKLLHAELHPEILSTFVAGLFAEEERNLLPSPLQAENFSEWFARLEKFLNELRGRHGKDYLHPAIRLALKYIEAHCREEISQPDIADAVHLNNSYFSTLFKKSVGKGFIDYLNELRIAHVKERLATSSEKAKAIATSEGFNDYQYFVKVFKRLTGLTPSEYRRKFLR